MILKTKKAEPYVRDDKDALVKRTSTLRLMKYQSRFLKRHLNELEKLKDKITQMR